MPACLPCAQQRHTHTRARARAALTRLLRTHAQMRACCGRVMLRTLCRACSLRLVARLITAATMPPLLTCFDDPLQHRLPLLTRRTADDAPPMCTPHTKHCRHTHTHLKHTHTHDTGTNDAYTLFFPLHCRRSPPPRLQSARARRTASAPPFCFCCPRHGLLRTYKVV